MTARTKRNIANTLTLLGLTPVLIWIILMVMALNGAFFPWISAGLYLAGGYVVLVSLIITGPVLMWSSASMARYPDIWTTGHRFPAVAAKFFFCVGILLNLGFWAWARFDRSEQPTQVNVPAEDNRRIQEKIDEKIREQQSQGR